MFTYRGDRVNPLATHHNSRYNMPARGGAIQGSIAITDEKRRRSWRLYNIVF